MTTPSELRTELQRLRDENEALRRLAETHAAELATLNRVKEDFLATASHDLKTPLTVILGWSQYAERLLKGPEPDVGELASALATVRSHALAMTRLLNDLLDAARVQAGAFTLRRSPCELGESVAAVLGRLSPVDRARVDVELASAPLVGEWDCPRVE